MGGRSTLADPLAPSLFAAVVLSAAALQAMCEGDVEETDAPTCEGGAKETEAPTCEGDGKETEAPMPL